MPRCSHVLITLAFAAVAGSVGAAGQAQKISKPKPAPAVPLNISPLPPAVIDNSLNVGGQDVKARKVDSRLSVDVQVNGSGPYRFVVDSGADTSAVGLHIARALQLPLGTPAILNGMTSRNIVDRVKIDSLVFGPTMVRNLELPALDENDVGSDGLIGIDALVHQRLMMDFEKHEIRVEDASKPIHYGPDDIVITARRQRGQLILTHVLAAGLSLDAVIDTGSEITIGNLALRDKLLRRGHQFWTVPVTGVTGVTMNLEIAKIDELDLGPVTLRDVPIAFADVPPFKVFGIDDQPALLLGTDILETFRRVSLDFKARKVRFQLRKCRPQGIMLMTTTSLVTRISSTATDDICGPS